jgi:hypothetical protein
MTTKIQAKLEQTKNFSLFVFHENQQPINRFRAAKIGDSMLSVGFLPSKPIQVYRRNDGKLVIIDGHHRFTAAKANNLPVFYVIEPESHSDLIGQVNYTVGKWSSDSFISLYASRGAEDYQTLLYYSNRGIPSVQAASLLIGNGSQSGNVNASISAGTFKIKTTKYIDDILSIIDATKEVAPEISKRSYIAAIGMALYVPDFSASTLIDRIKAQPSAIIRAADKFQALDVLDEVFNHRARIKINLSFQAKELSRNRSIAKNSK